ncbi:MAG: 16S rRNA (adenine(1518)-N(6)/adenine(1519)-N(6))-dimethyltransferase RsmA [Geminicoccaceae bacterium]
MTTALERLDQLPSVTQIIRQHGLTADRRLGQHFLHDPAILNRIVAAAGPLAGRTVVEIGPGPGGLTRALLAAQPRLLVAVERDPRCIEALTSLEGVAGSTLKLVQADALTVELAEHAAPPWTIVANLPYNIATELLFRWLNRPRDLATIVVMIQKEVAQRITAQPGTKDYGRLAIMIQWLCEATRCFDVPAGAFLPPPKVTSTVIRLVPRSKTLFDAPAPMLRRLLAAVFGHRRKMLRSSLAAVTADPKGVLERANISPEARPETLSIEAFCRLATVLTKDVDQRRNCSTNENNPG